MKKVGLIAVIALCCMGLIFGMYYINTANDMVEMRNLVKRYEGDIQAELQARFDKVPNLVAVVKGAAKHEETIVEAIADARTKYNQANATGDREGMLEAYIGMQSSLNIISERYPEIAAMDMFKSLFDEYSGVETAVTIARKNCNEVIMRYNNMIEKFPGSIIAKNRGFERIEEFKAVEEANNSVVIDMS